MRMCFCSTSLSSSLLWSAMHISQKHSQFYTSQLPICICSCQPAPFWQVLPIILLSTPTNPCTSTVMTHNHRVPVSPVQWQLHCPGPRGCAAMQRSPGQAEPSSAGAALPGSDLCCSGSQGSEAQLCSVGAARLGE